MNGEFLKVKEKSFQNNEWLDTRGNKKHKNWTSKQRLPTRDSDTDLNLDN